ncbi:MAG: hypothetical protein NDF52_01910 [archaeon YNP-WB-062]|nr:hypothetical protein [Candidatus Culexarchaeum yellowstonense]
MNMNTLLKRLIEKSRVKASKMLMEAKSTNIVLSEEEGGKIDLALEEELLLEVKRNLQNFTFIGEETGKSVYGSGKPIIIVDPLDGSTNAYRGYPIYSTSIAIAEEGNLNSIICGAVVNIVTGDIFMGFRGFGVELNGRRVKPSNVEKVSEALIAVDLNIRGKYMEHFNKVKPIIAEAKHVRFIGTDALETCFVAAGICDAFIDLRGALRLTDFAAACFMVKEAGGVVLNEWGGEFNPEFQDNIRAKYIASCNIKLANEIVGKVRGSS